MPSGEPVGRAQSTRDSTKNVQPDPPLAASSVGPWSSGRMVPPRRTRTARL
jgi:hypothetical protein